MQCRLKGKARLPSRCKKAAGFFYVLVARLLSGIKAEIVFGGFHDSTTSADVPKDYVVCSVQEGSSSLFLARYTSECYRGQNEFFPVPQRRKIAAQSRALALALTVRICKRHPHPTTPRPQTEEVWRRGYRTPTGTVP